MLLITNIQDMWLMLHILNIQEINQFHYRTLKKNNCIKEFKEVTIE